MNYKIFFALIAIASVAVLLVVGCTTSNTSAESAGKTPVANPVAIEKPADADNSFVPLVADENAAANAEDVLISAKKAAAAPEFADGKWINSDPLSLEKLRGQVVLVDFWTFGCYNCINTLPALKSYQSKYSGKGFTIVGVETPETEGEKKYDNLVSAVNKRGITYPVVTDYDSKTWESYNVNAWPTIIILDKQGRIRYTHVGEGAYDAQEKVIQTLLAEGETKTANVSDAEFNGEKIVKTEAEWKKELTPAQFTVLREKGTERAYTGELTDNHEHGDYYCAACHLKVFKSDAKFESGTGWPSFYQAVSSKNVVEITDNSFGESRTEVLCGRCGSHLGHVFDDGPKPTGLRYCMNSVALKFEKTK